MAGLATGLGAILSISLKVISQRTLSISLGFAAGIMIGISTLGLIPASLETGMTYVTIIGFIIGALFLLSVDVSMPHIHKMETESREYAKMGYFIALGIALHNLPEGIAIGATSEVSYSLGIMTAVTIGLHNVAEGLCVAMPLCMGQVNKWRIILITTMTGLSTLFGTFIGILFGMISPWFVAFSLAFAAGAMIYITSDELIPKSHKTHSEFANIGIVSGFILALLLS